MIAFLISTVLLALPLALAATSIPVPTATLPSSDWILKSSSTYPTEPAEHDPEGAGLIEYQNQVNYDFVMIYYENAVSGQMSNSDLQADVENIFTRDHEDTTMADSGIMTVAGVSAGFARGIDTLDNGLEVNVLELAFVKGNEYFNVFAYYDANSESESQAMSIINSISVSGASQAQTGIASYYIYIIIIVVAVVVVVVVLLLVLRRKKRPVMQTAPTFASQPPPPPPM